MIKTYNIVRETRTAVNVVKTLPFPEPTGNQTHLRIGVAGFYL